MFTHGLVRTNDNCIGCNKCIGTCSCIGAMTASTGKDGRNIIHVDGRKCIACGACFDACEHNAREFSDDTVAFFEALKKGEKISLLIAPAFLANYPDEYNTVLGGLKKLGVNRMINVSFGADITTWGYINYIKNSGRTGCISQPCPAVVSYIERYIPELIPKLIPVQSPLMCAAIYAAKYMGITDKLAFISPCIAKKEEITSERGKKLVSYNVTFDHLMRYVREHNIGGEPCADEIEYGLGSVYPMPGGLKENIYWFLGEDVFVRQYEGEKRMYHYLEANKERLAKGDTPYLLVDLLNCEQGCIYGTGTDLSNMGHDDVLIEIMKIRAASKNNNDSGAWSRRLTPEQRTEQLNKQFADLDLNDYMCGYTDKSAVCRYSVPTPEELEKIFAEMGKTTRRLQTINCSSCGFETCEQMAMAIHNGFNHKENCINYRQMELFAHEGIRTAMKANSPEGSIMAMLEYLGKNFNGDRAYVFEKNQVGGDDNTYEWVEKGVTAEIDNLQNLPPEVCANWYRHFSADKNIVIRDIEDIRESDPLQYDNLKGQSIRSLVVVPLYEDGKVFGFYGIDNPLETSFDYASDMLQIVAYFIVSCIRRRDMVTRLKEISLYDQLTHLGNRHAMSEYINKLNGNESIGVVYCDITGLKRVNDTEGHESGDRLIVNGANCLRNEYGGHGLFRIGGDELLAICSGISKDELEEKTVRMKQNGKDMGVILAAGCAWSGSTDRKESTVKTVDRLIAESETLMYKDKSEYYKNAGIDRRTR